MTNVKSQATLARLALLVAYTQARKALIDVLYERSNLEGYAESPLSASFDLYRRRPGITSDLSNPGLEVPKGRTLGGVGGYSIN